MVLRGDVAAETTSVLLRKLLLIVPYLRHQAPHHCGDLDPFGTTWQTSADFSKPPSVDRFWKVHKHDALSIPRKTLGLRPTDLSCHHETELHLDFVDWSNTWSKQGDHDRHISLKERPADCSYRNQKRRISEVMSDHPLSS